jgi:hypothetical protein
MGGLTDERDDDEISFECSKAIDGLVDPKKVDRHASIAMWEAVAEGHLDTDVRAWIMHVAEALLDADTKPADRQRDAAIVRAVGLAGKIDKHRALREFVSVLRELGLERQDMIAVAAGAPWRGRPLIFGGYDPTHYKDLTDAELGKIIDRELDKPET